MWWLRLDQPRLTTNANGVVGLTRKAGGRTMVAEDRRADARNARKVRRRQSLRSPEKKRRRTRDRTNPSPDAAPGRRRRRSATRRSSAARVALAAARLKVAFNADVMFRVSGSEAVVSSRRLSLTRRQVAGCTNCDLCGVSGGPVPIWLPGDDAKYAVIGEAPGPDEDRRGRPFVGKAGKYLKKRLEEAGLEWQDAALMNVVSCFPKEGSRFRGPREDEMRACYENLMLQLETARVMYVLLVGTKAQSIWRDDLKLNEVRGGMYSWYGRWTVVPTYHPAAALRNKSEYAAWVKKDIGTFGELVQTGMVVQDGLCVKCKSLANEYDEDGVAWCQKHGERYGSRVKKARGKWEGEGQATLL